MDAAHRRSAGLFGAGSDGVSSVLQLSPSWSGRAGLRTRRGACSKSPTARPRPSHPPSSRTPGTRIRRRSSAPAWSPSTRGRTTTQPRSGPRPASPCNTTDRLARRRRPGVSLALWSQRRACSQADALGRMSLFSARSPSFGVIAPTLARSATGTTAYWQSGERVYALTGSAPEAAIERAAASLNASLR